EGVPCLSQIGFTHGKEGGPTTSMRYWIYAHRQLTLRDRGFHPQSRTAPARGLLFLRPTASQRGDLGQEDARRQVRPIRVRSCACQRLSGQAGSTDWL